MANEYVTATTLKATLSLTGETFADADVTAACTAASRTIDQLCRRRFWADANAGQVRTYTPEDHVLLPIDDLVTMSSVLIDRNGDGTFEETWTQGTDYVLEPSNAPADGWPWERIRVRNLSSRTLPYGVEQGVQVTGKFGWSAVPAEIVDATTIYATRLLKRKREAPFGIVSIGIETKAMMRISRTDPDVYALTEPYSKGRPFF